MNRQAMLLWSLNHAVWGLFAMVLLVFGLAAPRFLEPASLVNLLTQASGTAIIAVGMTFVLLTAGVDLSVGAIMFLGAAVTGTLLVQGQQPTALGVLAFLGVGLAFGLVNAVLVVRLKIVAFVVTLATLFIGRGLALWITGTQAINLPPDYVALAAARPLGLPLPLWALGLIVAAAHLTLTRTPYGRQLYAVGHDIEAARKAGLRTRTLLASVYVLSGLCAALGGLISLAQLGAVAPQFGWQKEFAAIAAAVLGGTSLFGGRGSVFPGTLLGALLMQSVESGLVMIQADEYLYPMITSGIIFIAVLLDSLRSRWLGRLSRRRIRNEDPQPPFSLKDKHHETTT